MIERGHSRPFVNDDAHDAQNGPLLQPPRRIYRRRCVVLRADEQKAFAELQPHHRDHVGTTRSPRARRKAPLAFVVLWWVSVLTVIVGAILPGLGMAAAVGLGWLLWRYVPGLGDLSEAASDAPGDGDDRDQRSGRGSPAASIQLAGRHT
jgi:hypothetical protein